MSDHFDYHMIYSKRDPEPMAPVSSLYATLPSPTLDFPMRTQNRKFLTIRTPEESIYLLSLLLQPQLSPALQSRSSNQHYRPVVATAAHNYGAIGTKTDVSDEYTAASQPPESDGSSEINVAPSQPHKKCRPRSQNKGAPHDNAPPYSGHTVYFNQTQEGKIVIGSSALGKNRILIESTLKVTEAKTNPIVFKDAYGNLIGAIQGKPIMRFE